MTTTHRFNDRLVATALFVPFVAPIAVEISAEDLISGSSVFVITTLALCTTGVDPGVAFPLWE